MLFGMRKAAICAIPHRDLASLAVVDNPLDPAFDHGAALDTEALPSGLALWSAHIGRSRWLAELDQIGAMERLEKSRLLEALPGAVCFQVGS
jgi:hypothetical protein